MQLSENSVAMLSIDRSTLEIYNESSSVYEFRFRIGNLKKIQTEVDYLPYNVSIFKVQSIVSLSVVRVIWKVAAGQESRQKNVGLSSLVFRHHMPCSLHRGKGEPSQFPDHTADLIFVLVQAGHPPLSPLIQNGDSELISESSQPSDSTRNWNTVIEVAFGHPNAKSLFHQDGIQPITCIFKHFIIVTDFIAARLKLLWFEVELNLNGWLVEEVVNTIHVLADVAVSHGWCLAMRQPDEGLVGNSRHFLISAGCVEIQKTSVGSIKFLIINLPDFYTLRAVISKQAGTLNLIVLTFSVETMNVKIFILIDGEIDIVTRLIAFSWICAGVINHHAHQFYLCLSAGQFVCLDDLISEIWSIDACVALSSDVEIVFLQVRELFEEGYQSFVVVLGHSTVVVIQSTFRLTETDAAW